MTTLLVLAAGIGRRFGGPKQLAPVGPHGEVLMDYAVHGAIAAGFAAVVVVVRRDIEADIHEHVRRRWPAGLPVTRVCQDADHRARPRPAPPGTAHAVLVARPHLVGDDFVVVNADDLYGPGAYRLLRRHLDGPAPRHAMVGYRLRDTVVAGAGTVRRAVCRVEAGLLAEIAERDVAADTSGRFTSSLTGDELVSMNCWGFRPSILEPLQEAFERFTVRRGVTGEAELLLPTVVGGMLGPATSVAVLPAPDRWLGLTYPGDLDRARGALASMINAGVYPRRLFDEIGAGGR